jgi:hypothetical protein
MAGISVLRLFNFAALTIFMAWLICIVELTDDICFLFPLLAIIQVMSYEL